MSQNLIIVLVASALLMVVAAVLAYIFWVNRQNERFARLFKLMLSGNFSKPVFTGIYRRYQLVIRPFLDESLKNKHTFTKISIKMQNPRERFFLVQKTGKRPLPAFLTVPNDENSLVQALPAAVEGFSNDLMMCSLIFTDDIKRQLDERMREIEVGAVYLLRDELVFLSPVFAGKSESYLLWAKQMDLICDVKDAFQ